MSIENNLKRIADALEKMVEQGQTLPVGDGVTNDTAAVQAAVQAAATLPPKAPAAGQPPAAPATAPVSTPPAAPAVVATPPTVGAAPMTAKDLDDALVKVYHRLLGCEPAVATDAAKTSARGAVKGLLDQYGGTPNAVDPSKYQELITKVEAL